MSLFEDFSNIADGIGEFASDIGDTVTSAAVGVADVAADTIDIASDFVEDAVDVVSGAADTVVSAADTAFSYAGEKLEEATSAIVGAAKSVIDGVVDTAADIKDWVVNTAWPNIKDLGKKIGDVLENTAATILLTAQSLVEGVLEFGEAIVDLITIVNTAVKSIPTGVIDGAQALWGLATGNEWESVTKKMWDNTKGFVSKEHVKNLFDSLYGDTGYGQWIKNNAYGYETVRSVTSGIGYVAGVVALTIVTFGAGGAAVGGSAAAGSAVTSVSAGQLAITAGAAGIGKGSEKAWNEGASTIEGLVYGGANGLWEGAQFYLGGKIGGSNLFSKLGTDKLSVKALNIASRVALDGIDGGAEGFAQPLLEMIYKDESFKELFEKNGGWNAVATNAAVGSISSAAGEAFNLRKLLKDSDITAKLPDTNVTAKLPDTKINITTKEIKSKLEAAIYFNDVKQFIYNKLDDIAKSNPGNNELLQRISDVKSVIKKSVSGVSEKEMYENFYKYLDSTDQNIVDSIYKNGSMSQIYSDAEKKLIQSYTHSSGPAITAYLRNAETKFKGATFYGTSKNWTENYIMRSFYATAGNLDELNKYVDVDNFVKQMDNIIEKSPALKESIKVYRSVDSLYMNGNQINTFNIGQRFNDSAFISTSVVPTNISKNSSILLEIEVPKGTKAAYLESFTGVGNYNQQEILLGRNSIFEISDFPVYDATTGKTTLKVKLVK